MHILLAAVYCRYLTHFRMFSDGYEFEQNYNYAVKIDVNGTVLWEFIVDRVFATVVEILPYSWFICTPISKNKI